MEYLIVFATVVAMAAFSCANCWPAPAEKLIPKSPS